MRGSINFGLAAEIVEIAADFHYTEVLDQDVEGIVEDVAADMADVLMRFFGTGRIEYPSDPSERKLKIGETPPIPPATFQEIEKYIEYHIAPGDFVRACLFNDEEWALKYADEFQKSALNEIMAYIHRRAPVECWGSPEVVQVWLYGPSDFRGDSKRR